MAVPIYNLQSALCNLMSLIECVPNVSEGRRAPIIEAMAEAIRGVSGARVLDVSSDPSHHRSVFTLAGDAAALERATLALFERAVADIDLQHHHGEHPRVGAVDVVPFIPLQEATMSGCVALARSVGRAVAARFGIPVYLYGEAAREPARHRLELIRKGGLERLAERMACPEWAPDFGPSRPHPTAGVSVVGARGLLVAYNVNLATNQLAVAKRIASLVRERDGGLPGVKALGLTLHERGIVQVSMNVTDYERTSLLRVFEAVQAAAAQLGVSVLESEIVGLVPEAALAGIDPADLRLPNFSSGQILEHRLAATANRTSSF